MTITVIATFEVAEDQADAFLAIASKLVGQVRANEPGVALYTLNRARKAPGRFRMVERYAGKEDLKAHGETAYFKEAFAAMKPLLVADPVIELLDEVA